MTANIFTRCKVLHIPIWVCLMLQLNANTTLWILYQEGKHFGLFFLSMFVIIWTGPVTWDNIVQLALCTNQLANWPEVKCTASRCCKRPSFELFQGFVFNILVLCWVTAQEPTLPSINWSDNVHMKIPSST